MLTVMISGIMESQEQRILNSEKPNILKLKSYLAEPAGIMVTRESWLDPAGIHSIAFVVSVRHGVLNKNIFSGTRNKSKNNI